MQSPNEEKFRKINLENANFKARVGDIIGGKLLLIGCVLSEGNHVQMGMPESRPFTALDFVRPDRAGHTIERRTPAPLLSLPKLLLGLVQVLETLIEVGAILDR